MKLREKLATEYQSECLKKRPLQPFEDYYKAVNAFEAGFMACQKMAAELAARQESDTAYKIMMLGEDEV